jgi:hypothetical protein
VVVVAEPDFLLLLVVKMEVVVVVLLEILDLKVLVQWDREMMGLLV